MLHHAFPVLIGVSLMMACTPSRIEPPNRGEAARRGVMQALDRYLAAAKVVDPVGMSAAFTTNGVLFEPGIKPIEGRDSIRAFLGSFPGAVVESVTAVPDTIEVYGTTAYLWGHYFERLSFPGQPRSEQQGRFVIQWLQQGDSAWQIHRYYRIPIQTFVPAPS